MEIFRNSYGRKLGLGIKRRNRQMYLLYFMDGVKQINQINNWFIITRIRAKPIFIFFSIHSLPCLIKDRALHVAENLC